MSAATREIESLGHAVWMPLTLLINFSLFQYLLTIYFRRRWELRVILLLMCAFIGFVTLIPFAHTNERLVSGLNEISETSCTLTFLIQIVILGRDVLQNARIRSLHYLTFIAELFCLFGLFVVIQNLVEINMQRLDPSPLDGIMEDGGLAFVFIVRFFFLTMIIGLRSWVIAQYYSGMAWEDAQAVWIRFTMILLSFDRLLSTSTGSARHAFALLCVVGFVTLIPFAYWDEEFVGDLNDVSESCCTLAFLAQIMIIGRDITRKVPIRSLLYLTVLAELLCLFGLFVVIKSIVEACAPRLDLSALEPLDNIMENSGLAVVFVCRFYLLAMIMGIRGVLRSKRLELLAYFLFVTHEYPWAIAENYTGVTWEDAQAVWMRSMMIWCIILTIRDKIKLNNSKVSQNTTSGPKEVSFHPTSIKSVGPKPMTVQSPSVKVINVGKLTVTRTPSAAKVTPKAKV
ncbi:hypothetical protein Poli38472_013357 [Pythium oligandrum]|uniref:Uncharacterized protein n=1 Tax=Pythium oligandrum TaxID=41045 RepID=A0A8K1FGK8_PYTOL|nr:hypothetical protein Poli38472_013357 [Pythium oligandrum]|eukprot:TMW57883.1 hypothetical protein Poli38472_013357 [Pythium oligandrum]